MVVKVGTKENIYAYTKQQHFHSLFFNFQPTCHLVFQMVLTFEAKEVVSPYNSTSWGNPNPSSSITDPKERGGRASAWDLMLLKQLNSKQKLT